MQKKVLKIISSQVLSKTSGPLPILKDMYIIKQLMSWKIKISIKR
jgi:hypothetical protein